MLNRSEEVLENELVHLLRQRDRYALAAELTLDARTCVKHLWTVERLERAILELRAQLDEGVTSVVRVVAQLAS